MLCNFNIVIVVFTHINYNSYHIINNHVTPSNARELKNPSSNEDKEVVIGNKSVRENQPADPSKKNKNTNDENEVVFTSENVGGNEAANPSKKINNNK
ncbi:hypothetical protein Lal_00010971 [Lupinus albus]|nr:hypothetical protein Lal_00010971 [Lupinus albus]